MTDLTRRAHDRGVISETAAAALSDSTIQDAIDRVLRGSYKLARSGRAVLVSLIPDDSESIFLYGHAVYEFTESSDGMIKGHNDLIAALAASPVARRTLLQTTYLNGRVLTPFAPLSQCTRMTRANYTPSPNGTPLFTNSLVMLGAVLAKAEVMTALDANVQTATLIMTDGDATDEDVLSRLNIHALITDLNASPNHLVAGMAIRDIDVCRATFRRMGILPQNIFTAETAADIASGFSTFGASMLQLAASAAKPIRRP